MARKLSDLTEREILALAISLEEEDSRIYGEFADGLRERLRASIDEDRLAEVLVTGLESESAKERLDVAKLVLAELAAGPKTQGWVCTCHTAPGQFCQQLEPHGFRSVPKHVGLRDLIDAAFESHGVLELHGELRCGDKVWTRP